MSNEPDSEAAGFNWVEVCDTPERDNPKFGAVTLSVGRGNHSSIMRMTMADAEALLLKLTKYLNSKEPS